MANTTYSLLHVKDKNGYEYKIVNPGSQEGEDVWRAMHAVPCIDIWQ